MWCQASGYKEVKVDDVEDTDAGIGGSRCNVDQDPEVNDVEDYGANTSGIQSNGDHEVKVNDVEDTCVGTGGNQWNVDQDPKLVNGGRSIKISQHECHVEVKRHCNFDL
ncbi:hypothetical protein GOP47_0009187 [Adiantum capillus-veneris]|uniref:Uncharacterized protein n=1 Tax=Adiantum capillus-veneris TaxID=13818 RepID=A0A9D4UWA0_ADICA|nr:hypothetical protein GOP47_0009187 [Adiantum capillus-veneris]